MLDKNIICMYQQVVVIFTQKSFIAPVWKDIMKNVDVSVSLFKFKKKLKLYLLNNSLKLISSIPKKYSAFCMKTSYFINK